MSSHNDPSDQTMENCRSKNIISSPSGDKFSFPPAIPDSDHQFEFGPVTTPGSPKSPADHLFFNGKLLPHVFPVQTNNYSYSRSTSRTSSISSKDYSLMSSRSNSTNSRSSNCSSARTSISTVSEASSDLHRRISSSNVNSRNHNVGRPPVAQYNHQHGSSQRWQLIAAAPVLSHQGSRSRNKVDQILERKGSKKSDGSAKSWFGRKILKSFVSACKECHAIKT